MKKRNIDSKEYLSILKKIRKTVKNIEASSSYELVEMTLLNAIFLLRNEEFIEEDSLQEEGREIARKGMLYMNNIEKCARLLENVMKDILKENGHLLQLEEGPA